MIYVVRRTVVLKRDCRTVRQVGQNDKNERNDKGITQQLGHTPSIQRYNIRTALRGERTGDLQESLVSACREALDTATQETEPSSSG